MENPSEVEHSDREKANDAIAKLLTYMDIRRVIYIDDEYANKITTDALIELSVGLDKDKVKEIVGPEDTSSFWGLSNVNARKAALRKFIDPLDNQKKAKIYSDFQSILDSEYKDDTIVLTLVEEFFSKQEFRGISPSDWLKEETTILDEASTKKTLLLFDKDFKHDKIPGDGFDLVKRVIAQKPPGITCGLLSHTYSEEEEYQKHIDLSKEPGIELDDLIFISKNRVSLDPISFARGIKLTVLNRPCKDLSVKAAKLITDAQAVAKTKVEQIDIYDFEHIVFESSNNEGIWEIETLFRIFSIYHKIATREELKKDHNGFEQLAETIRTVSGISTHSEMAPKGKAWEIRQLEMYENEDYLTSYQVPLEAGDIFEKTTAGSSKKYMLLAQPCDLMVRPDGKRHQAINEVILAEIVDTAPVSPDTYFELEYYGPTAEKKYYVSFRKKIAVRLFVLDLCVYDATGTSNIKIGDVCPNGFNPAWQHHYKELQKVSSKIFKKAQDIQNQLTKAGIQGKDLINYTSLAIPKSSNNLDYQEPYKDLFPGTINLSNSTLGYDCRRIKRLNQPYASAMLTKYANYTARAAFEHDFVQ